jgi:hypothetical protein
MTVLIGGKRSRSKRSRSKRSTKRRSTKRRSTKKQRGGNLTPLQPLAISGYETPVITQHLPPGAISYDSGPANIEGGSRRRRGRKSSKRSRSKRSRSKRSKSKPYWGEYLARMAHPRSAVGGRKRY